MEPGRTPAWPVHAGMAPLRCTQRGRAPCVSCSTWLWSVITASAHCRCPEPTVPIRASSTRSAICRRFSAAIRRAKPASWRYAAPMSSPDLCRATRKTGPLTVTQEAPPLPDRCGRGSGGLVSRGSARSSIRRAPIHGTRSASSYERWSRISSTRSAGPEPATAELRTPSAGNSARQHQWFQLLDSEAKRLGNGSARLWSSAAI